jgi:hypothetical protein
MAQEDRTGNGHAASPRHFHHRRGPVYGLARNLDAPPSHARLAHSGWKSRAGTPWHAHARLPLRGQHRLFTCFPIVPPRGFARGHPVPSAAGRRLAERAPLPHGSNCKRQPLPAQSGLRGAGLPGYDACQRGFRRPVSRLRRAIAAAGEESTRALRESWAACRASSSPGCQTTFKTGC